MQIKKVALIGRGALGTIFGNHLFNKLGRENVCFIVDEQRLRQYRSETVTLNKAPCDFRYESLADDFGKADLILVSIKATGLSKAIVSMRDFVGEDTIIISLINGITSEDVLTKAFGEGHVIHCIARKMDAVKTGTDVTYTLIGELAVGTNIPQMKEKLKILTDFFDSIAFPYKKSEDIIHEQWSKLMFNCGLNQVSAAYNVPLGEIQREGFFRDEVMAVMKEAQMLAAREGIILTDTEQQAWLDSIAGMDPNAMPSMRQDVLAQRYTEVDEFAGILLKLAKKHNVEVPRNKYLYEKIHEIEKEYNS